MHTTLWFALMCILVCISLPCFVQCDAIASDCISAVQLHIYSWWVWLAISRHVPKRDHRPVHLKQTYIGLRCISEQPLSFYSRELRNVPEGVYGHHIAAMPRRAASAGSEQGAVRASDPAASRRYGCTGVLVLGRGCVRRAFSPSEV